MFSVLQFFFAIQLHNIWNPPHLDRIMENSMYVSEHGTDMYIHVYEIMNVYVHVCTCLCIYINVCNMKIHVYEITMFVCTWYIHVPPKQNACLY